MKRYRSPREVLAEVEKLLAARPTISSPVSALDQTVDVLFHARHYSWIGIYLNAGEHLARQAVRGPEPARRAQAQDVLQGHSKMIVPIQIGRRTLGMLDVESDREYAFGRDERVLLQRVASRLALYLATRGKHILRRLRDDIQPATQQESPATVAESRAGVKKSAKPLRSIPKPSGRAALRPASGATSY